MIQANRVFLASIIVTGLAIGCSASSGGYYTNDGGTNDDGGNPIKPTADSSAPATNDGGKKKDTGPVDEDAGEPVIDEDSGTTPFDAGKKDSGFSFDAGSGFDSGSTTTCAPDSVTSFTPTWKPPSGLHGTACTAVQAETWVLCQLDSSQDQQACKAFAADTANAACAKCIFTPSTAATLGPIIELPGSLVQRNVAGCIALLTGNTSSTGCGAKAQASQQCTAAACEANCPVPIGDDAALKELNDCETLAETTVCSSYATAAQCADALTGPDAAAETCSSGVDFVDNAVILAKLFCAP